MAKIDTCDAGRGRLALLVALTTLAVTACAPAEKPASAAVAQKLTGYYADASQPDISGFWLPQGTPMSRAWVVDGQPLVRDAGGAFIGMPYNATWDAVYKARTSNNLEGRIYGEPHFNCWPRGMVHAYTGGNATMTLTQLPGRIVQVYEEQYQMREIFLDGRPHPTWTDPKSEDYLPTAFGHSVGHFEGDTLVVDTIGVRREFTLGFLAPHSEALHVVERIRRVEPGVLEVVLTVDDPIALTKPLTNRIVYSAAPADSRFVEDFCTDNLRNMVDVSGFVTTDLRPRKEFGWDLPPME
jgi:hypothetical protein